MSIRATYSAQMDTSNGHGTLRITLHGRYHAEKHFQDITAHLLARGPHPLRITDTIVSTHQQRTYRIAPAEG